MHSLNRLKCYSFLRWQFFFFILHLFTYQVFSQTPFLRKYTVDDGLPSSHVYRVFQDSEGFMWVCTDRGLSRFDGYKFENFSAKNQLPYNDIWDIAEDNHKRLWLSSFAFAITYYDMESRKFVVIPTDDFPEISTKKIFAFTPISKDTMRIESERGFLLDLKKKKVVKSLPNYFKEKLFSKSLNITYPQYFTYRTLVDNYAFLLKNSLKFEHKYDFKGEFYSKVIFLNKKEMFLTSEKSVTFFNGKVKLTKSINELSTSKGSEILGSFLVSNSDNLLVLAKQEFFFVDKNLNRIKKFDFISEFNINSVYKDREGNLWICTSNQGLLMLGKEAQNSKIITNLGNYAIKSVARDSDGHLWIGSDAGDIFTYYNGKLNRINIIKDSKSPIRQIWITSNDRVCIVYHSGELCIFPKRFKNIDKPLKAHNIFPSFSKNKNIFNQANNNSVTILKGLNVKDIYEEKNIIYLGCSSDIKELILTQNKIIINVYVGYLRGVALEKDKNGLMWIGSSNGLYTFNTLKSESYKSSANAFPNLNKTINDIIISNSEKVWIATDVGKLIQFYNGKYREIKEMNGVIVKTFYNDVVGNRIWAATNEGVFGISEDTFGRTVINKISLTQGLPSLEVHSVCINNGKLYAATNSGLAEIDIIGNSRNNPYNLVKAPLIIKSITINGRDTTISNKYSLKYTQNSLGINFVAISFKSDRNIKYEYKLLSSGREGVWQETPDIRLTFNYLSPDTYQFYLRATDIDGNITELSEPLTFIINPPYWQTWWFRLLLGLILLGIVGGIILGFKKNTEKNLRVSKKLAELELQALQSQMNPHFVFNALSSIQSFILNKDTNAANEFLANFSRLIRLFLESSRNRYISIADEKDLLEKYIELEQARFRNKFTYEITDINLVESSQEIPSMLLQPFVENAINHGLVYKEGAGHLSITFKNENQYLYCTIEDDGVGRKKAKELRTKAIKAYKSRATEIIDERLRTLKMVDGTEVSVNIIDKVDENNISTGTKVEIKILMS